MQAASPASPPAAPADVSSLSALGPSVTEPNAEPATRLILDSLDEMKAEDVVEIDLRGRSALADTMIIASGRVARHVAALADRVTKDLKDHGFGTARIEGQPVCDWVLIDTGDVIVHLFRPEVRAFYNLEKIWSAGRPDEGRAGSPDSRPAEIRAS